VVLSDLNNMKKKNFRYIHRLVAETFHFKESRRKGVEVNHKDGNRMNNHADNLEWVSHTENMRHARTMKKARHAASISSASLLQESA